MTNFADKSTLGSRVTDASEDLSKIAESHQKWIAHLDSSIDAVNNDLKTRIREIRDRHRQARQEISNDLYALAREVGYLPPPSYPSIMQRNDTAEDVSGASASITGLTYVDQSGETDDQSDLPHRMQQASNER